jgi:hypothetical protein
MKILEAQILSQRRRLAVHGATVFLVGLLLGIPFAIAQSTDPSSPDAVHRWQVAHLEALLHGILLMAMSAGTRYIDFTPSQLRFVTWAVVIGAWGAVSGATLAASWEVSGRTWTPPFQNKIAFILFGTGVFGVLLAFAVTVLRGGWDSIRAFLVRARWKNWSGTVDAHPQRIERPKNRKELIQAVKDADGLRIRAAGGSYSWSPVAATDGVLIDCSGLTKCLAVEQEPHSGGGFIRVEAGVSIADLSAYAAEEGLTLESTTVIPFVLVGGAVANGCHGTGVHHPHFTDLVRELELIDAQGRPKTYRRPEPLGDDPTATELDEHRTWDALVVSLGTLGVIYSITFDCVEMFNVRAVDYHADMAETLGNVKELVEGNDYAEVFWFPYQERVWVKTWNRTSEPPTGASAARALKSSKQAFQNYILGPLALNGISLLPFLTPIAMKLFFKIIGRGDQVQPLPDALQYQTAFMKAVDMGYAIPIDENYDNVRQAWDAVVDRLAALRRQKIYPQNLVMHLRFVGPGRGTIAPSAGNDRTCYIEILTYRNTPRYPEYFAAVENDWIRLGGRTHWAKLCFLPETVAATYRDEHRDRVKEFLEVRAKHDPDEIFVNEWVRELLGM